MQADYVIVGAGSAGCVLANRLTEDPATRVVLIEAGGRDWNPLIHIPAGFMKLLDHPTLTWGFKAEADPGTNGRPIPYPRGRVLGGSSSINGLIYIRGQPEDFDHWAQLGNRGWGWDDVLPYFKQAENWQGETSELHGKGGFLTTSPMTERPAACQAIIDAGKEIGLEYRPDVNNLSPGAGDSIGWCQQTRGGRRRASAARTYLRPAAKRPNLTVVTGALVHRVIVRRQARGRRRVLARRLRELHRNRRCGARSDPRRRRGRLAASLAIVGRRRAGDPRQGRHPGPSRAARRRAEFPGPLHRPHVVRGERHRDLERARPRPVLRQRSAALPQLGDRDADLQRLAVRRLGQGAGGIGDPGRAVRVRPGELQAGADPQARRQARHHRRAVADAAAVAWLCAGSLPDPREQPAINPRYLAEDTDRRAMVGGLKFLRRLFAAPSLAKYIVAEKMPGPDVQTDDELLDYARQNGSTVYHASCSCMMGNHAMSVVDDRLRVHGLDALRVIDASVMPAVSSTNTNAPTIMIAEKGAALIREDARN